MAIVPNSRAHLSYLLMLRDYLFGALAVILTTMVSWHFRDFLGSASILLVYTLEVFLVAYFLGLGPSILSVIYSVSAFAFFFAPPIYSFAVHDPHTFLALLILLIVAIVTSSLMQRLRTQMQLSEKNRSQTEALLDLAELCTKRSTLDSLAVDLADLLSRRLSIMASLWLPDEASICEGYNADQPLNKLPGTWHSAAVRHLLINSSSGMPGTKDPEGGRYLLLKTDTRIVGVLRLDAEHGGADINPDHESFLEHFVDQIANQVERLSR